MYVIILKRSTCITKQQDNYLTIERRTSENFDECVVPVNPQRLKESVLMKKNPSNSARQLTSEKFLPSMYITATLMKKEITCIISKDRFRFHTELSN